MSFLLLRPGAVLAILASALGGSAIVAGAEPLTLEAAQRRAVARSLSIPAQDAAAAGAHELAVAAGQLPDPVLNLGVDNLPIDGVDRFSLARDFMTMRRIGFMQELTRAEKRHLRAQRFEREAEQSLAQKNALIAATQRDTALAWLDRYYTQTMIAVVGEQAGAVQREILAAESAYRAGRGSQADIFAAHGALAGLEDRKSELKRRVATATIALARWIGMDADAPLGDKPAIDTLRLNTGALDQELDHHPQIGVLAKQIEVAEAEARLAQADRKPDWSVELSYAQRGPAYSNMVSLGISIPLQWDRKNRQDRELAARLAQVEQARAQREDMRRAHIAEVQAMLREWENGRERLARYRGEIIPLAAERTRATLAAYRGAKASLNEFLQSRRNEIDVQIQALQLEADTARLWAQLNFLLPHGSAAPAVGATQAGAQ